MKKILILLALLFPALAFGQGVPFHDIALYNSGGFTRIIPTPSFTVCSGTVVAIPCSPVTTVYANPSLTTPLNPTVGDANGNIVFYVPSGNYIVVINSPGNGIPGYAYAFQTSAAALLPNTPLPSGASYNFVVNNNISYSSTLTQNATSNTSGTPVNGNLLSLTLVEDGTGGWTFAFPANFILPVGYAFDTIAGHTNALTFKFDGTNWNVISNGGSGGTGIINVVSAPVGACTPGSTPQMVIGTGVIYTCQSSTWAAVSGGGGGGTVGTVGQLQKTDGSGNHVASNLTEDSSNHLTIDDSVDTKGPNPNVAVTRFGARSFPINDGAPASPGVTATCTASNPSVPISGSGFTFFKNGNGIDLQQCGDAPTMSTPSAPTVTPAVAIAPVQSGYVATNSSAGAVTNRCYVIAAADVKEGVTAASPEVCVSGGSTILGSDPISMTSCARVGQTVTCLTSAHTLPIGCTAGACGSIQIIGTSDDANFGGSFPLASVPDSTHFTYSGGLSTANGATSSSTGGTMTYFNSDHLVLPPFTAGMRQYAIYEGASGAETLVGFSRLNVAAITSLPKFYDWDYLGSTYSGAAVGPYFWPTTPPVSALNQTIATTIVSGAGSSPVVVANAPTTTPGAGSPVLLDDCPGIQAAFNFANNTNGGGGMVSIPPETSGAVNNPVYIINSYCKVTGAITQSMPLYLQETLEFNGQWYGNTNVNSLYMAIPQFGIEGHVPIDTGKANPGIYFTGGSMRGVNIEAQGNSNMAMFHVNAGTSYFQDMNFRSNSTTGYNTTLFEDFAPGVGFGWKFTNVSFTGNDSGAPGTTFTPWLLTKGNTEISFDYIPMSKRGLYFQSTTYGMGLTFVQRQETQSLAMPWLSFYYGEGGNAPGHVNLTTVATDTAQPPYITNFASGTSTIGYAFTINGAGAPSSGGAFMTGAPFAAINIIGIGFSDTFLGQNVNVHYVGSQEQTVMQHDSIIGPSYGIYSMTAIPPAPTCATIGGAPITPAITSTHFTYSAIYPNGGVGTPSAPSATACSADGTTNHVLVTIPGALTGAIGYNVYVTSGTQSQYGLVGTAGCTTPNTTLLTGIPTTFCGVPRPSYIKGGPAGISPSLAWAPAITIDGPNGAGPKTVNADSNGSLQVGSRWIAALDVTAGDICAKINHIAQALMPSTGGVIDADGLGSQACATNPFAGVGSKGIKFTSVGTQFLTTAQWQFPPSFAWDCGVQGSATRGCSIVAQAGFPINTAVLEYGSTLVDQSIHVSGLTVDCGNISGSIGIEDQFAQEGAYANDVTINKCASIGLSLVGTGGGAQNSGNWERINVQTGTSAGANTLCIKMNQVPSAIEVTRYTCNMTTNSGTAPNYGVQIDGGGFLTDGQAQSMAVAGVVVGLNAASTSSTKINGLKLSGSVPTGVLISSAFNVQHVMVFGVSGAATNNLSDLQTTCTTGTTSALGFYDLDANNSSGGYIRLSGAKDPSCISNFGFNGLATASLNELVASYSGNHTLAVTEGAVIASASLTFTAPHALTGQVWDVYSKSGTTTLTIDGGTLYGNGTTGAFSIPNSQGVRVFCDGTNCYAFGIGGGGGGGGSGTVNPGSQYAAGYYSAAGSATIISGTNVGITGQTLTSVNASAPTFSSPALVDSANSPVSTTSYAITCDSGTTTVDRAHTILFQASAITPVVPDSTGSGCAGMVVKVIDDGAGALVFGRSGSDTFIVTNGTTKADAQTSFTLQNGDFATLSQNASTSWEVTITQNQVLGTPSSLVLTNATGLPCAALPALLGDTTSSAGSCTTATAKINGGTFPTSADVIGSDGSAKPIAATPHGAAHLLFCIDASGSGTTQVCNTTPSFSPGAGDMLIYKTGTTNTGALTLNVNSAGAAAVKKWQTTALVAGDILLNTYNWLLYDGTNWEVQAIGNPPGGNTALSALGNASGTHTLTNANNGGQLWQWSLTSNQIAWALGEAVAATSGTLGNQYLGQFITAGGSTAVPLNISASLTGSQTLPSLHITPTWNTSGVVDAAVLINVTNTGSGAASKLIDAQIGGTSEWNVDKAGVTTQLGKVNATTALLSSLTASLPVCTDASKNLTSTCTNLVTATQLAAQYSKGSCTEAWGGSGTSFAMTSGDDAISNNTCYNDSGVTRTITAVKCRSDNAANTTVLTPTFGSAGTGTAILTGTVTCGNSYAYSATGTVNNASWTTGTGIDPGMSTVGNATSIALIVEYTY